MAQVSRCCDIVLPVYNGLSYVTECINSLLRYTDPAQYTLYIIDDCSDQTTARYLEAVAASDSSIVLIRNAQNLGFLRSANRGMKRGSNRFLVLLNSDVVLVPDWLNRLLECANSDTRIASVNPLSNRASNIDIPMTPGMSFYAMDDVVAQLSEKRFPDVVTGVGFCMLLRRSALEEVGLFDEVYGEGYCEDSDLCMRLVDSGFRTVVADHVYVYHKGSASFHDRNSRYRLNRKIFDARWASKYQKQFSAYRKARPLAYLNKRLTYKLRWTPGRVLRETYRDFRRALLDRKILRAAYTLARGLKQLPASHEPVVNREFLRTVTRPGRMRITYVLHNITIAGGVHSVIQLVNELILLGAEVRLVCLYQYEETKSWNLYTRPIIYKNARDLIQNFPESDIAVATHWTTAAWVAAAKAEGRVTNTAYFLQDYESWFFPQQETAKRATVVDTYRLIPNKIVKSEWLRGMLASDGFPTHKIPLGLDLGIFYPRDRPDSEDDRITLLAMARPRTPRRGFDTLVQALTTIFQSYGDRVRFVLFGDEDLSGYDLTFPYENAGIIDSQESMAQLYSSCDVFVDASDFQGFGRTALEAMATQTACILTNVGGVTEYAKDNQNCILVEPKNPEAIAKAFQRLAEEPRLRQELIRGGLQTARYYCHKKEAELTLAYFNKLIHDLNVTRRQAKSADSLAGNSTRDA